jgi:PhnB protein
MGAPNKLRSMLQARRLMAFLATTDAARAQVFYRDLLGLELVAEDEGALVFHAGGTLVRIQKLREFVPAPFTVLGWHVPDLREAVRLLGARGVSFEHYGALSQDAAGIWTTRDGSQLAWLKDPDGNVLSLSQGVPEARFDKIIPELFVHDGLGALAFYRAAFGAIEHSRMLTPDGAQLVHGELEIAGHRLFVCNEFSAAEGGTCRSPATLGGTTIRVTLQVEDADAVFERALGAGAKELLPLADMFWGARYGKLVDPYGHEWGINQQLRTLTPTEEAEQGRRYFGG